MDQNEANRKKSEAQVEADRASLDQALADYETNILSAKANVEMAKADVRNAEIDLGYCRIFSPIDGRISRSLVDVGNLVGDGQATVLATVLKYDPIYAYFNPSEADLLRYKKMVREGKRADYRTDVMPAELGLANEQGFPHKGRIEYADPSVDPSTGTIQVRGIFANPDEAILPGMFVRLRVPLEERVNALLVPELRLGADQGGSYVLVVNQQEVVERRAVTPGMVIDGMRVIEGYLRPDDRIVINGLQRARPGARVSPKCAESGSPPAAGAASRAGRDSPPALASARPAGRAASPARATPPAEGASRP